MIETKLVAIDKMYVDPRYQRPENPRLLSLITNNFREDLLGTPVLSCQNDGRYAIIDAQHRVVGGKASGKIPPQIYCTVHSGLSLDQEAALFVKLNSARTPVHSRDKFKAEVVAKDPEAVEVNRLVEEQGLRIGRQASLTDIQAISSLRWIVRNSKLKEVLCIAKSWALATNDPTAYEGTLLKGLGHFLRNCPEADYTVLQGKLCEVPPGQMIQRIKTSKGMGLTLEQSSVERFLQVYNYRAKNKLAAPRV